MLTTYALADGIATITLDDGKVNALSADLLAAVAADLDRAEADAAVVVLTGRATTFSAGYDLRSMSPEGLAPMVLAGAQVAERLLTFPQPTVIACNGNAIAMGAFLLLTADVRVAADGPFNIGLREVAIGMTIPWWGIAPARHRLSPLHFDRCCNTGVLLAPEDARAAGFVDELVAHESVVDRALEIARGLAELPREAHLNTKLRTREHAIAGMRDGIERMLTMDRADW